MDNPDLKRVIALIDMDCFYCQVELRLDPSLAGKPVAVVQYNQWRQGGIIAVNYEARDRGVNRFMRGEDAKKVCPELCLPSVPAVRGKADLTRYRDAGCEVANVFSSFSERVERASVDEAFIDLTTVVERRIREGVTLDPEKFPSTFVVGYSTLKENNFDERRRGTAEWLAKLKDNADVRNPDYRLAVGALIVEEIRKEVLEKTGFHCSGGIGHNKILAKLVAGVHKPKCQTIIPHDNVPELYESIEIKKVRSLGGKFGKAVMKTLNITHMSELYDYTKEELQTKFNAKNGSWLYNIARGVDFDQVTSRMIPESIGCSKNFPGGTALRTKEKIQHWLKDMAKEVVIRLQKDLAENNRKAKLLTISFRQGGVSTSRSCPVFKYDVESISNDAYAVLMKLNQAPPDSPAWAPPIENLGLSTSKFVDKSSTLETFMKYAEKRKSEESMAASDHFESIPLELTSNSTELRVSPNKEPESIPSTSSHKMLKIQKSDPSVSAVNDDNCVDEFFRENIEKNSQDSKEQPDKGMTVTKEPSVQPLSFFERILAQKLLDEQKKLNKQPAETKSNSSPETPRSTMLPPAEEEFSVDDDYMQTCPECRLKIHLNEYLEHLDYHAALRVDRTLNGQIHVKTAPPKPSNSTKSPAKKKRKISGRPRNQHDITNFFAIQPK